MILNNKIEFKGKYIEGVITDESNTVILHQMQDHKDSTRVKPPLNLLFKKSEIAELIKELKFIQEQMT